jgi:Ca2+-binding RTX toxin-like protein
MINVSLMSDYADLALASYANFQNITEFFDSGLKFALQRKKDPFDNLSEWPEARANEFIKNWRVIDHQPDTGTDFSATVFERLVDGQPTGQFVFSMRGTAGLWGDLLQEDLANLVTNGLAWEQLVDMYNYWQRISTPADQTYKKAIVTDATFLLGSATVIEVGVRYRIEVVDSGQLGEGKIPPDSVVDVTGHSLGGHLAAAFSRLFPENTGEVLTVNGAGYSVLGAPFDNINNVFNALGGASDFDAGKILNVYGELGPNIVTQDSWAGLSQPGFHLPVFIEAMLGNTVGHGSGQMATALNLYELYRRLDASRALSPEQMLARYLPIFEAAESNADRTFEYALDALYNLVLGSSAGNTIPGDSQSFYQRLYTLQNSSEFQSLSSNTSPANKIRSLVGVGASALVALARADGAEGLAYRYALQALNPFAVIGIDYTSHNPMGQLDIHNAETGVGALSDAWLQDRAKLLAWRSIANTEDVTTVLQANDDNWRFIDNAQNYSVDVISEVPSFDSVAPFHKVIFDGDAGSTIEGGTVEDHLYGGGGSDFLKGGKGNDYLEGGEGGDSYIYEAGDGHDTILDTDGRGAIQMAGVTLKGGTKINPKLNVWKSEDGQFFYTLVAEGGNAQSLIISRKDSPDRITVKNFTSGQLNIDLPEPTTAPASPVATADVDFLSGQNTIDGLAGSDVIIGTEANNLLLGGLGNDMLFGGLREDYLEGGDGNDLISGGAGMDAISGGAGDDLIFARNFRGVSGNEFTWRGAFSNWTWRNPQPERLVFSDATTDDSLTVLWEIESPVDGDGNTVGLLDDLSIDGGDMSASNIISGGAGNDQISGGYGGDIIHGDGDDDTIAGLGGNDIIYGGAGNDVVGGGGDDDVIHGGIGRDRLIGEAGDDHIEGGDDDDVLTGDVPLLSTTGQVHPATDFSKDGRDYIDGGAGADHIDGGGNADTLFGGDGDDEILGDNATVPGGYQGDDSIDGGAGNDKLIGAGGGDSITGGEGNDQLFGDSDQTDTAYHGADYLNGEAGNDYLRGYGGNDQLLGGDGADELHGEAGADYLDGEAGNDTMAGGDGADELFGGSGDDFMFGDADDDVLYGEAGRDQMTGDDGEDRLYGGNDNDVLDGGAGKDILFGDEGDDQLQGRDGDDSLHGGDGLDILIGGAGVDQLNGDAGNDVLLGETGNDLLTGGAGEDVLDGGSDNDVLKGGIGNDTVLGDAGGDTLSGDQGADKLFGGLGNDVYVFNRGDGADAIVDVGGADRIRFGAGISVDDIRVLKQESDYDLVLQYGDADSVAIFGGLNGEIESVEFADGVVLTYDQLRATVLGEQDGGAGADELTGGSLDDVLNGFSGSDRLYGGSGNDVMSGDLGEDLLVGGAGDDLLKGGADGDTYVFNPGDGVDVIIDSLGNNRLRFGSGISLADVLAYEIVDSTGQSFLAIGYGGGDIVRIKNGFHGASNFLVEFADGVTLTKAEFLGKTMDMARDLSGSNGLDTLYGGKRNDAIQGLGGNDFLSGGDGADALAGGDGQDTLQGGDGGDRLDGGAGDDRLEGGMGEDTYVLTRGMGVDTASEFGTEVSNIAVSSDITLDDIVLRRQGADVFLNIKGGGHGLVVRGFSDSDANWNLTFAGGERISLQALMDARDEAETAPGGALPPVQSDEAVARKAMEDFAAMLPQDIAKHHLPDGYISGSDGVYRHTVTEHSGDSTITKEIALRTPRMVSYGHEGAVYAQGSQKIESTLLSRWTTTEARTDYYLEPIWIPRVETRFIPKDEWLATRNGVPYDPQEFVRVTSHDPATGEEIWTGMIQYQQPAQFFRRTTENVEVVVSHEVYERNIQLPIHELRGGESADIIHTVAHTYSDMDPSLLIDAGAGDDVVMPRYGEFLSTPYGEAKFGDASFEQLIRTQPLLAGWTLGPFNVTADYHLSSFIYGNAGDDILFGRRGRDELIGGVGNDKMDGSSGGDIYRIIPNTPGWDTIYDSAGAWSFGIYSDASYPLYELLFEGALESGGTFSVNRATVELLKPFLEEVLKDSREADSSANDQVLAILHKTGLNAYFGISSMTEWRQKIRDIDFSDFPLAYEFDKLAPLYKAGILPEDRVVFQAGVRREDLSFSWGVGRFSGGILPLSGQIEQTDFDGSLHAILNINWNSDSGIRIVIPNAKDAIGVGVERFDFADGISLSMTEMLALAHSRLGGAPSFNPQTIDNPLGDQAATETTAFSYVIPQDAFIALGEGDTLSYSISLSDGGALPSWLTFDAGTRTISGTPPQGAVGRVAVRVTAQNDAGESASDDFNLAIGQYLTGSAGADTITGGENADLLIGGLGADTLNGAAGDDVFRVIGADVSADVFNGGSGFDTIEGGVGDDVIRVNSLTAANGIERIDGRGGVDTLAGSAANDTIDLTGIEVVNVTMIDGGAGNDAIIGTNATDMISGGSGADTLSGRWGDDTYVVDNAGDVVMENADEGNDKVQSSVSYTLAENVENLTLTGASAIDGTGNTLANVLIGNLANNVLNGGIGADTLQGGLGNDTFVVDNIGDVVQENANEGADTVQSSVTFALSSNVENLTLTGSSVINATGNTLNNVLIGNGANNALTDGAGNDRLDGGAGSDTMKGGTGNDTYVVNATGDIVTENANEGTDAVEASISYTLGNNLENLTLTGTGAISGTGNTLNNTLTGNSANNTLTGGAGDDRLDGGAGSDTMKGGTGNDTYVVNATGDIVTENANEGTDAIETSVSYTLSNNVENLTLTGTGAISGTGNNLNNSLTGNSANNTLTGGAGNDRLDGGNGADTMAGGTGNDTYVVNATGDIVTENLNEGTDNVESGISYTLGANLESLTLTGTSAIAGTGNTLNNTLIGNSANNTLTGGAGNDRLDGGGGSDTMAGGIGNDIFVVNATGDIVTENASEGTDAVESSITYTLGVNLENLTLTGGSAINGTGNTLANLMTGNNANNTLNGGSGNDILQGGAGADTLTDTSGNALFNGGVGNDILTGGSGKEIYIGGAGNDSITTGSGVDVIAFNRGDGMDTVAASAGLDNTISIGGGVRYQDLSLSKSGNNLVLNTGAGEGVTLANWYTATTNRSVLNLQVIAEAIAEFDATSSNTLLNNKVERFNFGGLVNRFDAARTANPTISSWALTNALLDFHLGGSDSAAIGGDLAYQYGKQGGLANVGSTGAQNVLANSQLGTASHAFQSLTGLQEGTVKLG